jgi:peroxiredoxin
MRRPLIYGSLMVAVLVAATAYWLSHRELVVARPNLGGPPPTPRKHENLVGRRIPAFPVADHNGQPVPTTGRVAVVNIWATWCQPCVAELPRIEREIWQRFRPHVTVIAIAREESAAKIRDFNRNRNLTFSLVADPEGTLTRQFGGDDVIPRTYVIDRSGAVVHQVIAYNEREFGSLVSVVERAVAER